VPTGTLVPSVDQQLLDDTVLEHLDVDVGLVGLHEGDDGAAADLVAGRRTTR
jgi:hypothetical protein